QIETNLEAEFGWFDTQAQGGSLNANGQLVAGDSAGVFVVQAISKGDSDNEASSLVFVSPRAEIFNQLLEGGFAIYMRHAIANVGSDQFDVADGWHRSCSSDTARQLSDIGRDQARDIGLAMRKLGIPISTTLYSSEFCRCEESLNLLGLPGEVNLESAITYYTYGEDSRHTRTLDFIDNLEPGEENILLMSHSFAFGAPYPSISQGYTAIFDPENDGEFITIITDAEWKALRE
ncbi:MAG: hypothetical protein AAFV07_20890, partial [Bacteroidota bacterium]